MSNNNIFVYLDFTFNNLKAGRVVIELYKSIAPKSVENFRALCTGEKGIGKNKKPLYYKGSKIHKVISQCMIQGGDIINGNGSSGESIYGQFFDDENYTMKHDAEGVVGYVNNNPDSNSSQFYITIVPCYHLDYTNVAFGKVIKGFDIIREMTELPKDDNDLPLDEILISDCGEYQLNTNIPISLQWNINENDGTNDIYPPWPTDLDQIPNDNDIILMVENINKSGNWYYNEKDYLNAERKYNKALRYIDWYSHQEQCKKNLFTEKRVTLLLNLSAVQIKMNKNRDALEHCNEVIKSNPYLVKAFYRRAKAMLGLQEFDNALNDLKKAHKLNPDEKSIINLFEYAKRQRQKYTQREKLFCEKFFQS